MGLQLPLYSVWSLSMIKLACVAGAWKQWAEEKTGARGRHARVEVEARSLFRPLIPSACYAGYDKIVKCTGFWREVYCVSSTPHQTTVVREVLLGDFFQNQSNIIHWDTSTCNCNRKRDSDKKPPCIQLETMFYDHNSKNYNQLKKIVSTWTLTAGFYVVFRVDSIRLNEKRRVHDVLQFTNNHRPCGRRKKGRGGKGIGGEREGRVWGGEGGGESTKGKKERKSLSLSVHFLSF